MSPSPLGANLAALASRFPELASLVEASDAAALEPVSAASGEMSARAPGGAWLHSGRDPRVEARRLAAASLADGADTLLLLGLGLGYVAEACLEAGAERLLACEAEPGTLKAAFGLRDMSALLADERLGFVMGGEPEGVISALELSGGSRAGILELRAISALRPDWYARARAAAGRWNAKGAVNENTLRKFGKLWVRNLAANLDVEARCPGVERLEGLLAGRSPASAARGADSIQGMRSIPALVLAAGPSLDLVLPRLEEIRRRCLLVAVDTSLRSVLRRGIEPDFLVVVDPQYWNYRHLAGLSSPSSILVSEAAAWPAAFRSSYRATFLGGSLFPLGRRIEAFAGRKGQLGAGGSVATSAWDLCRIMGASPVWMAGLDLSYPEGKTHAAASLFEQRALASGTRLSPASGAQAAPLVDPAGFDAPSADGGRVRTDQRMSLYAWWFESRFARPSSPPTISLSARGLAIPGLRSGGIDELLSLPDRRGEIDALLARAAAMALARGSAAEAAARAAVAAGLEDLASQLEAVARGAESAELAARAGRAAFASGGDCGPCLAALEAADAAILGIEARDLAGFLLPSSSRLLGRGARDLGESLERSEALYRGVAESARYHLDALKARESGE